MDKSSSSVSTSTQYIICECGDNFPNETFLKIHLENGHADVETFLCDACPEAFTSLTLLLRHKHTHKTVPPSPHKSNLKTYASKAPLHKPEKETLKEKVEIVRVKAETLKEKAEDMVEKKTPVIKVQNLKRIDSISLIQNLKSFKGFIKLEPPLDPSPVVTEQPVVEVPVIEELAEESPVLVKAEALETEDIAEEIYYQCDVCNSIFYTEADFNVHYQSTHALKQEPGTAEQILEDHLKQSHSEEVRAHDVETAYYYECESCQKIFASERYFNIHYNRAHGGSLPVDAEDTAELEEATSSDGAEAEAEPEAPPEPRHKAEQVIYYKCDLCKILYPSEKAYNTHFDKKHGQNCQQIQSSQGFQFIEQELVETPLSPSEMFQCEYCPKSFGIKRSLQVHKKRVHPEYGPEAPLPRTASRSKVCDICGRAYNSNAALRYHQRRHTGEKPYPCTICPKRFTMPMFLQIHLRTHTGEKPYTCPHCPKAFTNKAALIRHDRVHTGVKPYACPECGKYFTQSNSMKLHVSTVHLKLPAPYKSKSRRSKSEARALQLALKAPRDDMILGD